MAVSASAGSVYISVIPTTKGAIKNLEKQFSNIQKNIKPPSVTGFAEAGATAAKTFASKFITSAKVGVGTAAAGVGAAYGVAITKGLNRLVSIEEAQAKLKALGVGAADVTKVMENATAAVSGTHFGLAEASGTAAAAMISGMKPGKELEAYLTSVGDAAAMIGAGFAETGVIFNKVLASGMMQGDVIAQFEDRGLAVRKILSQETGKSMAEINELSRQGKLGMTELMLVMNRVSGASKELGKTTSGSFKNVFAALGRLGATLWGPLYRHGAPFFQEIIKGVDSMNETLKPVVARVDKLVEPFIKSGIAGLGERIGASFEKAVNFVDKFVTKLQILTTSIIPASKRAAQETTGTIQDVWGAFWNEENKTGEKQKEKVKQRYNSIVANIEAKYKHLNKQTGGKLAMNFAPFLAGWETAKQEFSSITGTIGNDFKEAVKETGVSIWDGLKNGFSEAFSDPNNVFITLGQSLSAAIPVAMEGIKNTIVEVTALLKEKAPQIKKNLEEIIPNVAAAAGGLAQAFAEVALRITPAMWDVLTEALLAVAKIIIAILPLVEKLTKFVNDNSKVIGTLLAYWVAGKLIFGGVVKPILKVGSSILKVGKNLLTFGKNTGKVAKGITGLGKAAKNGTFMASMLKGIEKGTKLTGAWGKAFSKLGPAAAKASKVVVTPGKHAKSYNPFKDLGGAMKNTMKKVVGPNMNKGMVSSIKPNALTKIFSKVKNPFAGAKWIGPLLKSLTKVGKVVTWVIRGVAAVAAVVGGSVAAVVAVVIAAVAAVVLIWKNWDKVKAAVISAWQSTVTFFTEAGTKIGEFFNSVKEWGGNAWDYISQKFEAFYARIQTSMASVGNFFIGLINGITTGINSVTEALNAIQFTAPDWLGGWTFGGLSIGSIPQIPALATGADVMGPTVALLGEKEPETVVNRGLMNSLIKQNMEENARLRQGQKQSQQTSKQNMVSINVYASPGMNERTLAKEVAKQAAWATGR